MYRNLKQIGFTLIELVITISLFAVLAALAMPSYQQMIQNTMVKTATDSIQSGFQVARAEAVKRNANVQFDFRGTESDWTVCTSPAAPGACPTGETNTATIQSRKKGEGSSSAITVSASNDGPYVFDGFGVMTSPVGAVTINVSNSAANRPLRIVVGVGGAVKTCDPALETSGTDPRRC